MPLKFQKIKFFSVVSLSIFYSLFSILFFCAPSSFGAVLRPEYVSDLISNSVPSNTATHVIQFRVTQPIPASGKIVITPEVGALLIPLAFNVSDIDFAVAVSSSSPYADRAIANVPNATTEGVSIQSGFSGSFTFTLNSSEGLSAGNMVRIELGTNATYGTDGINLLVNSDVPRSYKIAVETRDASDAVIDLGGTMIAIIESISVGPIDTTDIDAPIIYNGMPAGLLPGGTKAVEISVYTNEYAFCRYATTTGVAFAAMTGTFPKMEIVMGSPDYLHYNLIIRNLLDSTTYSFYVRCRDYQMNANLSDYVITFKIGVIPDSSGTGTGTGTGSGEGTGTGTGTGGGTGDWTGSGPSGPGSGGIGDVIGGGNFLKTSDVFISGTAYPFSKVTILLDGKEKTFTTTITGGKFSSSVLSLERGTYTFGMYAVDAKGIRSSMISSTVSLLAGSVNTVSGILFPPTITTENNTVNPGDDIVLSGMAIPSSTIEVYFGQPSARFEGDNFSATSTTDTNGFWTATVKTKGVAVGNYVAQARSVLSITETSGMSTKLPLGIGKEAAPDFSLRADLNKDGKVNLVDFSLLLFSWGTDDGVADINVNGKVDLTDFSIMIYYWTG
jgi:hypothetical protein